MASNPQHEPTMEEILASIRKIISEDSNDAQPAPAPAPAPAAAAPAPAPVAAAPAPVEEEEAEVLELTQEVEEPKPAPEPVKLAAVPPAPKYVEPEPENDIEFRTVEEAPVSSSHDDIFSDKTRKAIDDTFANIQPPKAAEAPAAPAQRAFSASVGDSVEAVFERAVTTAFDPVLHQWMDKNKDDLLAAVKPLIREWMDEHFPALLEGAVRNEVERVVKARGR